MRVSNDPQRLPERDYQDTFTKLLKQCQWETMHVFPLMDKNGVYRTPTTAKGWLDMTALRGPYVIAAELKGFSQAAQRTAVSPDQQLWLERWVQVPTARVWVIDSMDPLWGDLVSWVMNPKDAPRRYGW